LLLIEDAGDKNAAARSFDAGVRNTENRGATMKLIGAMISTVAFCCLDKTEYKNRADVLLTSVRSDLPEASKAIKALEEAPRNSGPARIRVALGALPFNYH
jgi:hypothetical protein